MEQESHGTISATATEYKEDWESAGKSVGIKL